MKLLYSCRSLVGIFFSYYIRNINVSRRRRIIILIFDRGTVSQEFFFFCFSFEMSVKYSRDVSSLSVYYTHAISNDIRIIFYGTRCAAYNPEITDINIV